MPCGHQAEIPTASVVPPHTILKTYPLTFLRTHTPRARLAVWLGDPIPLVTCTSHGPAEARGKDRVCDASPELEGHNSGQPCRPLPRWLGGGAWPWQLPGLGHSMHMPTDPHQAGGGCFLPPALIFLFGVFQVSLIRTHQRPEELPPGACVFHIIIHHMSHKS